MAGLPREARLKRWNKLREKMGVPPIEHRKIKCLNCGEEFISKNYPSIRVCTSCKNREPPNYGIFDTPLSGFTLINEIKASEMEPVELFQFKESIDVQPV